MYVLGTIAFYMPYAVLPSFFSELFGPGVRYTGLALGTTIGTILGNSLAPLIAASLFTATGSSTSISLYVLITAIISLVCVLVLSETKGKADNLPDAESVSTDERTGSPSTEPV